jgi:hypothetical protein
MTYKFKRFGYVVYVYDEKGNQVNRISIFDKTEEELMNLLKSMYGEIEEEK